MFKDLLVSKVYAADPPDPIVAGVFEGLSLGGLFTWIVNLIIVVGFGLVLVFLATGFIMFITSQGDKVNTEKAQKWVTYAIVGGVGLFAVYAIKALILDLLDVTDPLSEVSDKE